MYRKVLNAMLVVLIALSLSTPAMAQESGRQFASGEAKSYIVVMAADAILAYDGGVAGYAATKPEEGKKSIPTARMCASTNPSLN